MKVKIDIAIASAQSSASETVEAQEEIIKLSESSINPPIFRHEEQLCVESVKHNIMPSFTVLCRQVLGASFGERESWSQNVLCMDYSLSPKLS